MMSRSFHKIAFGGIALAAVALATVSGGNYLLSTANAGDTSQSRAAVVTPLANHDPEVREALLALFSGSATRYAAQEELVQRCMKKRGFTYVQNPSSATDVAPTLGEDPYGLTVEQAQRTGYKSAENAGDSPGEVDRSGISKLSEEEQKRWGEAFFGRDDAPEIKADLPGGGRVGTTSEGCLAEAREKLYGSLSDYVKLTYLAGNLPIRARREASSDADMTRIDSAWSSCMASKEHSGLKNPDAARGRSLESHRRLGIGSDEARAQEISLAVADAECEKTTDYAAQRIRIEDRYYEKMLQKFAKELTDARKMNASALLHAKEALGAR
ncbi:hypothetical protein ABZV14_45585 [Streptosporangium canum]|uniref:hypothetical protein n=1 Tax=Streptosporangium canum TaxID=324952 RepID=UPI0033AC5282